MMFARIFPRPISSSQYEDDKAAKTAVDSDDEDGELQMQDDVLQVILCLSYTLHHLTMKVDDESQLPYKAEKILASRLRTLCRKSRLNRNVGSLTRMEKAKEQRLPFSPKILSVIRPVALINLQVLTYHPSLVRNFRRKRQDAIDDLELEGVATSGVLPEWTQVQRIIAKQCV